MTIVTSEVSIDEQDIKDFFVVFKEALTENNIKIPVIYKDWEAKK